MSSYAADHGFTPGKFLPDKCRVMLARYPCPFSPEQHNPDLPPEDINSYGYKRKKDSCTPGCKPSEGNFCGGPCLDDKEKEEMGPRERAIDTEEKLKRANSEIDRLRGLLAKEQILHDQTRRGIMGPKTIKSVQDALNKTADDVPVDLWCTYGMMARNQVEGFKTWLREQARKYD